MARSYMTRSQLITKLCMRRKSCHVSRARALLENNASHLARLNWHIDSLNEQISEMHRPPYLNKKKRKP